MIVTGIPRNFVVTLDEARDLAAIEAEDLSSPQLRYADFTVAEVIRRGLPIRAAIIALETELTESALLMYANGNNPESLRLPHDAVGWDHGSVGLYQQQVGGAVNSTANWGTTAQLMNVAISTDKFLNALSKISWGSMTNWAAAQRVQGSFDPSGGNYRRNDPTATALANQLWEKNMPISDADVERIRLAIVTTDIHDGPGTALLYKVIGNTQAAVANVHDDLAVANTKIDALTKAVAALAARGGNPS